MEPIETRTEEIAGQVAADAGQVVTPVADQADEVAVAQNDVEQITATTEAETTETTENVVGEAAAENTVEETVVESTSVILSDTESNQAETSEKTEQPVDANDSSSCLLGGCPNWALIGGVILGIVIVAVIIKQLTKKTGSQPAKNANGKPKSSEVVEIYVGNLSYDMTDNQLRKEFERFGVVKSARVITHRTNNKSKGYGFVEMPHRKEALIAIKALENADVMGRRIRVNEARANTRPPER